MKSKKLERALLIIAVLIGFGMIFIGVRFLVSPETGERGYGLNFRENTDYSFHYIKGIRDLFSGTLILALALWKRKAELALTLGLGTMIPIADFLIVLNNPNADKTALWIHGITTIVLIALTGFLFRCSSSANGNALTAVQSD